MISSDLYLSDQKYKESQNVDQKPLPSIIVCPPSVVGHWCEEIEKFTVNLKPVRCAGSGVHRNNVLNNLKPNDVLIITYDILRRISDTCLQVPHFNYCVLDEGHIIRSGKSKTAKATKMIHAKNRLILSGTPVQNEVLELWSLFDFLMPGFLGTEKEFNATYSKPLRQSKDAPMGSKEFEAGMSYLESLHRQVLPFLLRRMKEDVLHDLPPKVCGRFPLLSVLSQPIGEGVQCSLSLAPHGPRYILHG